ncbi:MAG TPA: glycoside hydrolase family 32 protein [Bacteroidales bacterium]|nr:glycoside hydrolase family 32 protein [Bacteroidales bacterium]
MKLSSILLFSILVLAACNRQLSVTSSSEPFRPLYHFTPDSGWMNDPNGLVYYDGEYHLFYQYYPDSTVWGPMHWGHAVSTDMVHWNHLPIALYPDSLGYIFSGSAVMDLQNTSGLGDSLNPAMVAIYAYHNQKLADEGRNDFQYQGLAYSTDKGRTWTKYPGNPVVRNPGIRDFRDPKVTWYEPSKVWIMTLAAADRVQFYSSPDLLHWKFESEFGQAVGAHGGVWECPDLFELPVAGKEAVKKWVLLVSINPGAPNGGSGTQYFIGNFDGHRFTWEESNVKWVDYGMDNYAGVTWSNTGDRRIFLGWMSNWAYAQKVPTHPWRSAMTIPRELSLVLNKDEYLLKSAPVREFEKADSLVIENRQLQASHIRVKAGGDKPEQIILTVSNKKGQKLIAGFDSGTGELWLDRRTAGISDFDTLFASNVHSVFTGTGSGLFTLDLYIDRCSAELFFNGGVYVITDLIFPRESLDSVNVSSSTGNADGVEMRIWSVKGNH